MIITKPNTSLLSVYKRVLKLMGNRFELSVVADDETWAQSCIDAGVEEIRRIEKLLTTFSDDSETNQVNQHAGIAPVKVSRETFNLIQRSLRISAVTQGAFDITYGSIDKRLWNFDEQMTSLPDKETAQKMVRLINYRNVILDKDNCTVFLREKGMRIGFGGIGKGYAAEMAKRVMIARGVESGVVNASGDLTAWGLQPNGRQWTIGISNPDSSGQIFSQMDITGLAVATSGNYEKFAVIGGKRYSHTINPRTGLPVSGIKSVTIISTNAEIADAMATPVTIMGVKTGLDMINQMKDIEAIIIDDENRLYTSNNININLP
ncbi:thiamine biosynthesis protein ApbE [Mucilaginibacter sp. PPCGB 2223]|uniref:FAD:protein FMN transferase n=1 Tax=Mucilaginibacter sp. PPCGB 2223 TaxID=1886027 RepID=UPI000825A087|nr:FAD:protein FMN transferase [Mucilaginibacter sp. PPCGB 2223]OCX53233.1 thiamine biosynthesis protein ApbE [Mucilaginibacter sp. PPCGB 2223]